MAGFQYVEIDNDDDDESRPPPGAVLDDGVLTVALPLDSGALFLTIDNRFGDLLADTLEAAAKACREPTIVEG